MVINVLTVDTIANIYRYTEEAQVFDPLIETNRGGIYYLYKLNFHWGALLYMVHVLNIVS